MVKYVKMCKLKIVFKFIWTSSFLFQRSFLHILEFFSDTISKNAGEKSRYYYSLLFSYGIFLWACVYVFVKTHQRFKNWVTWEFRYGESAGINPLTSSRARGKYILSSKNNLMVINLIVRVLFYIVIGESGR